MYVRYMYMYPFLAQVVAPASVPHTEHNQYTLLLQSTAMSANVVFINIDWKSSRMHARFQINMRILAKTIAGVVRAMNPSIICMSEVGETKHPLSEEQMQQVATRSMSAWQDAATEHIQLRSMFTTGSPYMTVYIDGPIQCSDHRILHKLYSAAGEARDAQTFVCTLFDHESVDMVNVHAPSGKHKLQDKQRRELLTNLLQSNSQAKPGSTIGQAHFVMGGDMNTGPHLMSQLLQECRHRGSLRTQTEIHEPTFPKHGDLCIVAGFQARTLTTSAPNHDPRHDPYGICWSVPQSSATEQPLSFRRATKQSAAQSSGCATEQSLPALSGASAWLGPEPPPPTPPPTLEPAMEARLEVENLAKRAVECQLTDSEIERELVALHARRGDILKPEDFLTASEETAADLHLLQTAEQAARIPDDAAAATEHSEETTNLPAEKQLIYSIVNAFLDKITFHHPQAEELLMVALQDEMCLTPSIHLHVEEVFSPIFFHYPNGLKDRSVWEPRDTSQYIRQWYELASMREGLTPAAAATEHGQELSKGQVTQIFRQYMQEMKKDLRPDQQGKKWTYYKGCAEAKMRREAGHVFLANAVWTIGLPWLPPFATEQRESVATEQQPHGQLSTQNLDAIAKAIQNVLEWLDRVATALLNHRTTPEYQEALRKSGIKHGQSGLSATEQETRGAVRKARYDMRTAKDLAQRWQTGTLTWSNSYHWQRELLNAYWDGSLHARLGEVASADTMCRTPSFAVSSTTKIHTYTHIHTHTYIHT